MFLLGSLTSQSKKTGSQASFVDDNITSESNTVRDVDLVPMINVVFLLLIFFMVVGVFRLSGESSIVPPSSKHNIVSSSWESDAVLFVRDTGLIFIGDQLLEIDDLAGLFETFNADDPLLVRAAARAPADVVINVLRIAGEAGLQQAGLQTVKNVQSAQQ